MGEENEHGSKPYDRPAVRSKETLNASQSYKQTYRKAWEELPDFKGVYQFFLLTAQIYKKPW